MENQDQLDEQMAATRRWGALATRLGESVGRAREALVPHAEHLPSDTLASLDTLLAEFARRRVRIALYGEVKSGKSTLLNAIAGAEMSPTAFEPLTSIPVRVTYGERNVWEAGGCRLDTVSDLERLMREADKGIDEVVVETNLDLLQLGGQVDLVDTPGVGSEAHFDVVTAETLRWLDAVVLVVRYPALFTQFTRRLMDSLEADIGKLFVVWNLDAACADLSSEDLQRQTETLRANVAGAHQLFLVDARAAFQARQAHDDAAEAASGLRAFSEALGQFAASRGREIAALREAAKQCHRPLGAAQQALTDRQVTLDRSLTEARKRLEAGRRQADTESAALHRQLDELYRTLGEIEGLARSTAARLAAELRTRLRRHRLRWMRTGDIDALEAATSAATAHYGDEVAGASQTASKAVRAAAERFAVAAPAVPDPATEPSAGQLAPQERRQLAVTGRAQLLRRALWHRWYLPVLSTLLRDGIDRGLAEQAGWLGGICEAVRSTAANALTSRLADIEQRCADEQEKIRLETNFVANQAEFTELGRHLPLLSNEIESVTCVIAEARALAAATD